MRTGQIQIEELLAQNKTELSRKNNEVIRFEQINDLFLDLYANNMAKDISDYYAFLYYIINHITCDAAIADIIKKNVRNEVYKQKIFDIFETTELFSTDIAKAMVYLVLPYASIIQDICSDLKNYFDNSVESIKIVLEVNNENNFDSEYKDSIYSVYQLEDNSILIHYIIGRVKNDFANKNMLFDYYSDSFISIINSIVFEKEMKQNLFLSGEKLVFDKRIDKTNLVNQGNNRRDRMHILDLHKDLDSGRIYLHIGYVLDKKNYIINVINESLNKIEKIEKNFLELNKESKNEVVDKTKIKRN